MHWNNPKHLPTVGAPLRLRMRCGRVIEGVRPSYISKATTDDPMYVSRQGKHIDPASIDGWAYQAYSGGGA